MPVPNPTPLFRILHKDNLPVLLARGGLHSPNHTPNDGLVYRTIHNTNVQASRQTKQVPCGAGGNIHDYVPFYFGPLSVMLLNLRSGRVAGYNEGQAPLIYLETSVQALAAANISFAFSDGHGLATFSQWSDDLSDLNKVDWNVVSARYWADRPEDNDRQRRKQAEFLAWQHVPWGLVNGIGVLNLAVKNEIDGVLARYPAHLRKTVNVRSSWYY